MVDVVIVQCAWCGRVRTPSGWEPQSLGSPRPGKVTHGICEDCKRREVTSMDVRLYYVNLNGADVETYVALERALLAGTAAVAGDGRDRTVVLHESSDDGARRTTVYSLEADTKVDDEDATFPVVVHTEAILVGENA